MATYPSGKSISAEARAIIEIEVRAETVEKHLEKLDAEVEKVKELVKGNGDPGLSTRITVLEEHRTATAVTEARQQAWTVLVAQILIGAAVVGVGAMLVAWIRSVK